MERSVAKYHERFTSVDRAKLSTLNIRAYARYTKGGNKMLSGEFRHGIDPKNRLFIPARHREELGESFVIAKSIREKCLRVYSMEEWQAYIRPIEALDGKDKERIVRALSRNAAQVTPDSQGRVVLTPDLIKYAEIDKNTYIVGCGHYSEIWSDVNYEAMVEEEDLASMRDLLESYGL